MYDAERDESYEDDEIEEKSEQDEWFEDDCRERARDMIETFKQLS
jgi:hypothetical protein